MKGWAALIAIGLICGCGGDDSDFSSSESAVIYADTEAELHQLHDDAELFSALPATYIHNCPEGGTITMEAEYDAQDLPIFLGHTFDACETGGSVYNGFVNYENAEYGICDGEGFGYDITGELSIAGTFEGDCAIDARMQCNMLSGDSCGHSL